MRPEDATHMSPSGVRVYRGPLESLAVQLGKPLADVEDAACFGELRAFMEDAETDRIRREGAEIRLARIAAVQAITERKLKAAAALATLESRQSRTSDPLVARQILAAKLDR